MASGDPRHPAVRPEARVGVVAHLAVGSLARTVERVRQQLAPSSLSWAISDELVHKLMRAQVEGVRASGGLAPTDAMIERLDLIAPIGCALLDPGLLPGAGACLFGYQGGALQLARDLDELGPRVVATAPAGHTARFEIDGQHAFFLDAASPPGDGARALVLASMHADARARLEPFLRALTADPPTLRDVELSIYPGPYSERALSFLDARLRELAAGSIDGDGARLALERAARADYGSLYWAAEQADPGAMSSSLDRVAALTPNQAGALAELVAELRALLAARARVGVSVDLEGAGLVFSSVHERRGEGLDPPPTAVERAQLEAAPRGRAGSAPGRAAPATSARARAWAALLGLVFQARTGQAPETIADELAWFAGARGERVTWSMVPGAGERGVLVIARDGVPAARDVWRAWSEGFSAARVLGPEGARHLRWEFIPQADVVEGAPIDRWVLTLEPAMDDAPGGPLPDVLRAWWVANLGRAIVVDRLALDDRLYLAVAPESPAAALAELLAAGEEARARGEASLIDPGVSALLERHSRPTRLLGFNVGATVAWFDRLAPAAGWGELVTALGGQLSDVYRVDAWSERGGVSELVLSQGLLDDLRGSFGALAGLGGDAPAPAASAPPAAAP
ncbi:MAG: hypothetical protein H6713_28935 [Myxococcales bacterium]|nr:hypothetical protein [Myxococcales bacterium]